MDLKNTIRAIEKDMADAFRQWSIIGIKNLHYVIESNAEKQECDIEGFEHEYVHQYELTDAGDDFAGSIFLPIGEDDYLHIDFCT